jgi:hypothetical protein
MLDWNTHTAESLVHKHSSAKEEIGTEKLKRYKLPGINQNLAEMTQGGSMLHSVIHRLTDSMLQSAIHKLIKSIWNKEDLQQQWKELITLPIYRKIMKLNVVIF